MTVSTDSVKCLREVEKNEIEVFVLFPVHFLEIPVHFLEMSSGTQAMSLSLMSLSVQSLLSLLAMTFKVWWSCMISESRTMLLMVHVDVIYIAVVTIISLCFYGGLR